MSDPREQLDGVQHELNLLHDRLEVVEAYLGAGHHGSEHENGAAAIVGDCAAKASDLGTEVEMIRRDITGGGSDGA